MIFHFHFDLNTVDLNVLNNQFIVIPISPAQVIISPQKFKEVKSLQVSISFDLLDQLITKVVHYWTILPMTIET